MECIPYAYLRYILIHYCEVVTMIMFYEWAGSALQMGSIPIQNIAGERQDEADGVERHVGQDAAIGRVNYTSDAGLTLEADEACAIEPLQDEQKPFEGPTEEVEFTTESLNKRNVQQLRMLCSSRLRRLSTSGKKDELIHRLTDWHQKEVQRP